MGIAVDMIVEYEREQKMQASTKKKRDPDKVQQYLEKEDTERTRWFRKWARAAR